MMGNLLSQVAPPKAEYGIDSIPSQKGKIVLVTGGNSGIGKETARVLLEKDAHVYLAARDPVKGNEAVEELKQLTGKDSIELLEVDLASIKSVLAAARVFKEYVALPPVVCASTGLELQAADEAPCALQ
jgi:retinol dehydrogenase-12